jgi:hypothetical protein
MPLLSKSLKIKILWAFLATMVAALGLIMLTKHGQNPKNNPITAVFQQSEMLRDMANHANVLGIAKKDLSWDGQNPTSLSKIYQDLWPITPPVFQGNPPLNWQMGWAGEHLVFFLEGLSKAPCQALNEAMNIKDPIAESLWSKQDLLRRKATFPPVQDTRLQNRGCVKTLFATHVYYDVL